MAGVTVQSCFVGRDVVFALRPKRGGQRALHRITIPRRWPRSALLAYVRKCHPQETVRIVRWASTHDEDGNVVGWLPHPGSFTDYRTGVLA